MTQGSDQSLTANGNDRPNLVYGVPVYLTTTFRSGAGQTNRGYLNPAAFTLNTAPGKYGTITRNAFRGRPTYQVDAQIPRIFPIHKRLNLDFRLEALNVLNHPNFSNPRSSNPAAPNLTFGRISGTRNSARIFQGWVKFSF